MCAWVACCTKHIGGYGERGSKGQCRSCSVLMLHIPDTSIMIIYVKLYCINEIWYNAHTIIIIIAHKIGSHNRQQYSHLYTQTSDYINAYTAICSCAMHRHTAHLRWNVKATKCKYSYIEVYKRDLSEYISIRSQAYAYALHRYLPAMWCPHSCVYVDSTKPLLLSVRLFSLSRTRTDARTQNSTYSEHERIILLQIALALVGWFETLNVQCLRPLICCNAVIFMNKPTL